MSNLVTVAQWHDTINKVDVTEPILGGDGGNANLATRQLAENILWLKQRMANQINEAYAVGDIYTTTIKYPDAAAVAAHHGYGTWVRYAEGRTLVGQSTKAADPDDYKTIGNTFGENEHTLTIDEMPTHNHPFTSGSKSSSVRVVDPSRVSFDSQYLTLATPAPAGGETGETGGDQPHNNIQPSIVAAYWLRTA